MDLNINHSDLLESLFDGVYYVDQNRKITYWNEAAERITGFKKEEVLGKDCSDNILRHINAAGCEICTQGCPLHQTLRDGKEREAFLFLHHKDGHRVPVHIRIASVRDENGEIKGGVEVFSDNSRQQRMLKELQETREGNLSDPLLDIGNRRFAEMVFEKRLYELKAYQTPFSAVLIDLDDFKPINDTYGHSVGDRVLKMVARSVENSLRSQDSIIRWGGDELVAIIPNAPESELAVVLERIRAFIERSFLMVDQEKVVVTASLGATLARPDDTLEDIIDRADQLMYQSKKGGKNSYLIG